MKKNVVLKGFLVLLVISLMITGFIGCDPALPPGTVYLVLTGICTYDLFMDSAKIFSAAGAGTFTLTVTTGSHIFEAFDTCEGSPHGADSVKQFIVAHGFNNYVYLNPKP